MVKSSCLGAICHSRSDPYLKNEDSLSEEEGAEVSRRGVRFTLSSMVWRSSRRSHSLDLEPIGTPILPGVAAAQCSELLALTATADPMAISVEVEKLAHRLCDADFTSLEFHAEVNRIFPEMRYFGTLDNLLVIDEKDQPGTQEYARTMNAFDNLYHILRLDIDAHPNGKESFVFGTTYDDVRPFLNETPAARSVSSTEEDITIEPYSSTAEPNKWFQLQCKFMREFTSKGGWELIQGLVATSNIRHTEVLKGALVLSAIHDVFKLKALKPPEQADHDLALQQTINEAMQINLDQVDASWTNKRMKQMETEKLRHRPSVGQVPMLPSFEGLSYQVKEILVAITFNYNHGWFVQAETSVAVALPDVPIFRDPALMALYALHWIADVGGANPDNSGGSSTWFLWGRLGAKTLLPMLDAFSTLTRTVENGRAMAYYAWIEHSFKNYQPIVSPSPVTPDAVARMRLTAMAQHHAERMDNVWLGHISKEDKELLMLELALTGIADESFPAGSCPADANVGPALSCKFCPQYLREHSEGGDDELAAALHNFAEIHRLVRAHIGPATVERAGENIDVILRIVGLGSCRGNYLPADGENFDLIKVNDSQYEVHHVDPEALAQSRIKQGSQVSSSKPGSDKNASFKEGSKTSSKRSSARSKFSLRSLRRSPDVPLVEGHSEGLQEVMPKRKSDSVIVQKGSIVGQLI